MANDLFRLSLPQLMADPEQSYLAVAEDLTIAAVSARVSRWGIEADTPLSRWVHPEDWPALAASLSRAEPSSECHIRGGRRPDWHLWNCKVWPVDHVRAAWFVVLHDETAAYLERQRYEALVAAHFLQGWAEWVYEPDRNVHRYDPEGYLIITGETVHAPVELSHERWLQILHPDDRPRMARAAFRTQPGKTVRHEYRVIHRQGQVRWIRGIGIAWPDISGSYRLRGLLTDITDEKQAQAAALQAEKLSALAVLAGGIAHDFNNKLALILGNLSVAERGSPDDVRASIKRAARATEDASTLATQLMALSQGTDMVRKPVPTANLLRTLPDRVPLPDSVVLEMNIPEDLWPVLGDAAQLGQVLENLLRNAIEAVSKDPGGRVRVDARNRGTEGDALWVEVTIADTGPGVPLELRPRIFDPYFTTKPGGHGLGLASAHTIVEQHKGTLSVEDAPEGGARFRLLLPPPLGQRRSAEGS